MKRKAAEVVPINRVPTTPYREPPPRRIVAVVGPSRGARTIVTCGTGLVLGLVQVSRPGWHWLLVDGLVLVLIGLWTHSWREARRWQAIAYLYGEPPPHPPELEHESLSSLLESAASNAAGVVVDTMTLTQEMDALRNQISDLKKQQQHIREEHQHTLVQSLKDIHATEAQYRAVLTQIQKKE